MPGFLLGDRQGRLSKQLHGLVGLFQGHLKSGANTRIPLEQHVPVHLVYRTAFTSAKGRLNFRRDVYGRDAKIFNALLKAGVTMRAVRG